MARVVLYPVAIQRTARAKAHEVCGPLAREVLAGGRHLAPKGSRTHGSGRVDNRPSLAASFKMTVSNTPRYVTYDVINTAAHAATVAKGSRPHEIRPKTARVLAFSSERFRFEARRAGQIRNKFFARKVRHPGNKRPVRFLQTPLAQFGRKRGFKVTTVANNRSRLP